MPNNDEILNVTDERDFWFAIVDICVWDDESLSTIEKAVYTALCTFASADRRRCFPSVSAIARRASCSMRAVYAALAVLSDRGYMVRNSRYKGKEQIPSDYSLLGHKSDKRGARGAGEGVQVVHDPLQEVQTELEPKSINNTLPSEEAANAAEALKDFNAECEAEGLYLKPETVMMSVPSVMKEAVTHLLSVTGREGGLTAAEIAPLKNLARLHTPLRVIKEIDTAAARFELKGRPAASLTFDYIWQSLKNQGSTLKAAFRPRKSPPPKKTAGLSREEQAYQDEIMKKWGGEDDVGNGKGAGAGNS